MSAQVVLSFPHHFDARLWQYFAWIRDIQRVQRLRFVQAADPTHFGQDANALVQFQYISFPRAVQFSTFDRMYRIRRMSKASTNGSKSCPSCPKSR